mmetsp:Transcript_30698/g.78453  ORF Transcript_30698/g.78453 Transcript_30698/m.78453 type:complete len:103 (-) Transcript_30698:1664-1972(-)
MKSQRVSLSQTCINAHQDKLVMHKATGTTPVKPSSTKATSPTHATCTAPSGRGGNTKHRLTPACCGTVSAAAPAAAGLSAAPHEPLVVASAGRRRSLNTCWR